MKMEDLRKELGVASQGRVAGRNESVLFHLAFRLDRAMAERFIRQASNDYMSEALWGRQAIIEKLMRLSNSSSG